VSAMVRRWLAGSWSRVAESMIALRERPARTLAVGVDDLPRPLHAWPSENGGDHLAVLEEDVRRLIREVGIAKTQAYGQVKEHREETRALLLEVAEALDAFARVFDNIHERQDAVNRQMKIWVGNFRTVYRLLAATLSQHGVVALDNLHQGFDPQWHEVGETVADPDRPDGTIVKELRKGYLWRNELLRRAEVVVVRNRDETAG
jgi:molecular chaperone GrpE (heat shock protein)